MEQITLSDKSASIEYGVEPDLTVEEFRSILIASSLGQRRPIDDAARLEKMLQNADLIVTARYKGKLVGIARSITDFSYCCYLSDLAVDVDMQKKGLGKRLIEETERLAGPGATLVLLSAPAAQTYYPCIGMEQHASAWIKKK